MNKKNQELSVVRGIALWAVVGIHTFSMGTTNIEVGETGYFLYKIIHTLLQFAVPCFIFLASILLSYNLGDKKQKLVGFYKKKGMRILVPYFVWTFIYVIPKMFKGWIPFDSLWSKDSWLYWFLWGKGHDHLYFMSVMVQICIVAPLFIFGIRLIMRYAKKYSTPIIITGAVVGQVVLYLIYKRYIYSWIHSSATLMISYFLLIVMGIYIGFNYDNFIKWLEKRKSIVIIGTMISASIYIVLVYRMANQIQISTTFYQMNWYVYTFLVSMLLVLIARKIQDKKFTKYISWIGTYSFGIYLIHPIQTFFLKQHVTTSNPVLLMIIILVSQALIILSCGFLTKMIQSNRLTAWVVGEKIKENRHDNEVIKVERSSLG